MDKIIQKFEEQNRKMERVRERDMNKSCLICRKTMCEGGFSSIPRICKKCEDNAVYGSVENGQAKVESSS